jgi:hypothetical protein
VDPDFVGQVLDGKTLSLAKRKPPQHMLVDLFCVETRSTTPFGESSHQVPNDGRLEDALT